MKVRMNFPMGSDGPLWKAARTAAAHPSYSVGGDARVSVALDLPADWRTVDELLGLLRGERNAEFEAGGETVAGEELASGLRCFFRKQRSGKTAHEWCTPGSLAGKQVFPCKQIRVYDNDHRTENSWYSFGEMDESGTFRVDKEEITERVLSDLGPCVRCPILDLEATAEVVANLPDEIDPKVDEDWRYRENGPMKSWTVVKSSVVEKEEPEHEERRSLLERIAQGVTSGGVGVAAVSGTAPGTRSVPPTRYEDVGGMEETISLIREAVELPMKHPEIFRRFGIRPHRGILFHGPPGTGKTLLARAVAHESGAHFIAVSGPEILNKYWGQSEQRLRSIFNEAKTKAPAIILFDEIDSFASARDTMSESFEATLVSQLLSLMDGMSSLGRVCVIATTNRPSALDPALRRPGRFDHEIEVGLPDSAARRHILRIHTRKMPTDPDLNLEQISNLTGGYSGADLEALCREAALSCVRRSVNLRDFDHRMTPRQLHSLKVTNYDFRAAMKRVGPSLRR
jgi:transitional endoplasmic reticulum ATPase